MTDQITILKDTELVFLIHIEIAGKELRKRTPRVTELDK